jgi:hypothetical protein
MLWDQETSKIGTYTYIYIQMQNYSLTVLDELIIYSTFLLPKTFKMHAYFWLILDPQFDMSVGGQLQDPRYMWIYI